MRRVEDKVTGALVDKFITANVEVRLLPSRSPTKTRTSSWIARCKPPDWVPKKSCVPGISPSHVITMTNDLLKKIPLIGKDLDQFSLETVKMFYEDAKAAGYSLRERAVSVRVVK